MPSAQYLPIALALLAVLTALTALLLIRVRWPKRRNSQPAPEKESLPDGGCRLRVNAAKLQRLSGSSSGAVRRTRKCGPNILRYLAHFGLADSQAKTLAQQFLDYAAGLCTDAARTGKIRKLRLYQLGEAQTVILGLEEPRPPQVSELAPALRYIYAALQNAGLSPKIVWRWFIPGANRRGCYNLSISW